MNDRTAHRVPRAGLDRIDSSGIALAIVRLAVHRPARHETIVVLLDHLRCGLGITVVANTSDPDDVVEVTERIGEVALDSGRVGALVVASVRPGDVGPHPGDTDRWLEMSELVDAMGLELLEWFVVGTHTHCPRDLLGESPRW